jgi:tetratricopeptide (TPR) repeat protein
MSNTVSHLRATLLTVRGHQEAAIGLYRHILESEPVDPAALISVLQHCRAQARVEEAVAVATRALDHDPNHFIALDGLAWAYLQRGEHDRAMPVVAHAIRSFDALNLGAPTGRGLRMTMGITRMLLHVVRACSPTMRRRYANLRSSDDAVASASSGLSEWRTWATGYLDWYSRARGSPTKEAP